MLAIIYIYVLLDPISGEPRYVGKTKNPVARLRDHSLPTRKTDQQYPVNRWSAKLRLAGRCPTMRILQECNESSWANAERRWIRRMRKRYGRRLLNIAEGGQGGSYPKSDEHRKKIADSLRGRTCPPRGEAWRSNLSKSLKGKPKPPMQSSVRAKISASLMGNTRTLGRKLSPEHRDKVVAVLVRPDVQRKAADGKAEWWEVTHPNGQIETVRNLETFSIALGLDPASMNKVANGRQGRKQHKGYRVRRTA